MATDDAALLKWVYGDEISMAVMKPLLDAPWWPKLQSDMSVPQREVFKGETNQLSVRERMLVNIAILACVGRERSFRSRCHGLLRGGFQEEELAEVFRQVAMYAGMPTGVECSLVLAEAARDLKAAGVLPADDAKEA
ncbi:carboxymuconolactone decarboxylase family protein [Blastococcus sp. URHD0036]|uniref:carboxymuconolactone decarboxylase family protein n=1 Tax=Blastococcus sp. URHD0036 TaxID=1380356 RepID=UPI0018CC47D2|nr:carboxymuconolactone decarboxylase family protein [Blastococcus sp. URHD0036]